ncbi:sugar phosphate isomerase/epimerase family protein [Chondrinema litorale]|uniref:sugar phosphate isomerase/epimerase family protein n=1 Tax=Chondrinema litorale TaxID=2994555 RepID=UPI002542D3A9|nr:sugar phosphate isomerase/epimerase [Chondrinema litorale]UZR96941.1 sugar phosphate isomerase/epimerase [Chondrinema litorale]
MKTKTQRNFLILLLFSALYFISFQGFSQSKFGGATLYTVRAEMDKAPEETLQEIANIGYKYIEATGYKDGKFYGMEPKEFKKFLKKLKLTPVSTHMGAATLDNADEFIADAKAAGFKYFVIPVPPMGHFKFDPETRTMYMSDDIEFVTNFLTTVGKKCKDAGMELLYHNHDFEFKEDKNGIVPIEHFLKNTDPEIVNFQMDLYWVTKAGADPVEYFEKFPGRFKMWHVKDMDEEGKFAPVGTGTIDFAKIREKKELSGMIYYIVEQDQTFELAPLEAIKISHGNLKKFGFK